MDAEGFHFLAQFGESGHARFGDERLAQHDVVGSGQERFLRDALDAVAVGARPGGGNADGCDQDAEVVLLEDVDEGLAAAGGVDQHGDVARVRQVANNPVEEMDHRVVRDIQGEPLDLADTDLGLLAPGESDRVALGGGAAHDFEGDDS
jgi:hypothetical protein